MLNDSLTQTSALCTQNLFNRKRSVLLARLHALHIGGGHIDEPFQEGLGLGFGNEDLQFDFRAELGVPDDAAPGGNLQLHPLIEGVGSGYIQAGPDPFHGFSRRIDRNFRTLGVGPDQSAGTQQDAAEIPGHHAHAVI